MLLLREHIEERQSLVDARDHAAYFGDQRLRIAEGAPATAGEISQLNFRLGMAFADASISACREFRVALSRVELIGSHGQTIFHQGSPVSFLGRSTSSTTPSVVFRSNRPIRPKPLDSRLPC